MNGEPLFDDATLAKYYADGSWNARPLADHVRSQAERRPDGWAFRASDGDLTWRQYDVWSTQLAATFLRVGMAPGDFLAVLLTGGALVHLSYLAAQKAGLVTVGIGPRAGDREIADLIRHTDTEWLLTRTEHRGRATTDLLEGLSARAIAPTHHVAVELSPEGPTLALNGVGSNVVAPPVAEEVLGSGLGPDELFFINSTSGTTGRSKCVMATMNNRMYFGDLAVQAGELTSRDVFCSVVPSPYGFGLWSAHVVPTMLGATTVLTEEFDAARTLRLIECHNVTFLAAVTSQLVMMLNSPAFAETDLSSLRVVFTGGERVPPELGRAFEGKTGARILQFYGSNEAGPISVTRFDDPESSRLNTVGRPIPGQRVRLFDSSEEDVSESGRDGQIASLGPGVSPGYYRDDPANAALFRADGWQLTGDLGRIDDDGYLVLTGRVADLIIRGGQNISVLEIENEVGSHPRVAQVAVVGVSDPVLGERACAVVVTRDGLPLELEELCGHLEAQGISKHHFPERIEVRAEFPLNTGGKTDKQRLRRELADEFGQTWRR